MGIKKALLDPQPKPGKILEEFESAVQKRDMESITWRVKDIDEQKRVANAKLDYYLSNASESPGARKIIEYFYEEYRGEQINSRDPDVLREEVSDTDSILHNESLPRVSKEDLRDRFNVRGDIKREAGKKTSRPSLVPRWVKEHKDEPYTTFSTSGSTGEPWKVVVTRNDWGMRLIQWTRCVYRTLKNAGISAEDTNVSVAIPSSIASQIFTETFEYLGSDVRKADFNMLKSGGDDERKEADTLIRHVNSGEYGIVVSAIDVLMKGKFGVEIRRGNVDADLYINGGSNLSEKNREFLQKQSEIKDYFGETEYPQAGGSWETDSGTSGFERPLEGQLNVVYEDGQIKYDGQGRYGYVPFGQEGQVIPGIYMSGVNAVLEISSEGRQYLSEIKRVENPGKGCV